eukprot:TRINITY_DN23378_c0_g1_i5.p4 TRINITY_DN23378_c0_g1~~TRINITY_DN23378_c0_g1_i5.p4  ORF type:complete len:119 (+),score=17.20 TRINITY_DN23378_c0_g1_i5:184-540(+)
MGCFTYSQEDGTPAEKMENQVGAGERGRRRDELFSIQQDIQREIAENLVGEEIDVLIEGKDIQGTLCGRTQWDCPDVDPLVFVDPPQSEDIPQLKQGQIRKCKIYSATTIDICAYPIQ